MTVLAHCKRRKYFFLRLLERMNLHTVNMDISFSPNTTTAVERESFTDLLEFDPVTAPESPGTQTTDPNLTSPS